MSSEPVDIAEPPVHWSAAVAWAVGVIATDGNLGRDRRHLTIVSKDLDFLNDLRRELRVRPRIGGYRNGPGRICYRLQWSDARQHAWLRQIGLTPAKSLTLGPVAVPDDYFADFFRGCIDGDGSIVTYTDRYNTVKNPTYVYTRLYVSLVSASHRFVEWLRATVHRITGASGSLKVRRTDGRNDIWCLRYAKAESLAVLRWIYYAPGVPCLGRIRRLAEPFLIPRAGPSIRRPGRPVVV